MGVQPFLISSSLVGVLAQRLVRTLCDNCKVETKLSDYELQMLDIEEVPAGARIYKPIGCEKCTQTGYSGMTVVAELLLITDKIRGLILQKADASRIKKAAIEEGMISLAQDSLEKIFSGITSVEEVLRAIISEADDEG